MIRMKGLWSLALVLALWAVSAEAQTTIGGTANVLYPARQMTRGVFWHSYANTGASGARAGNAYGGAFADMDYPGFVLSSFDWFYGARAAGNGQVDLQTHNGRSHGWWISAKPTGASVVSYSSGSIKGKEESDDVVMMAVDPTKDFGGRFATVGNDIINTRSGGSMANWWPGTPVALDAKEPREILNYKYGLYTDADKDNFPEDIVLSKWTTKLGITGEKTSYAWGHPEYGHFVIEEWVWTNTGDSNGDRTADLPGGGYDLKNVFFTFQDRMMTSGAGVGRGSYVAYYWDWGPLDGCTSIFGINVDNGQDDKIKYTEAPNYDGPASAKGLKMNYQYDWDNYCMVGSFADDVGDPWRAGNKSPSVQTPTLVRDGDLTAIAMAGIAELDVDPTNGFAGDNGVYQAPKVAQQPFAHNLFWFQFREENIQVLSNIVGDEPDPTKMNDATMYEMLTRSPDPSYFTSARDSRPTRGSGSLAKKVPLLPLDANPTKPMPYMPNPDWEWKGRGIAGAYTIWDTYGPYDLAPGQKVKMVFVRTAGAPVESNFRDYMRAKDNSELRKEENGLAFTNLVKHLKKAQEAYALGYDIPNQPPDVNAKIASSENARNLVTWTNEAEKSINPDKGAADIAGYKVYVSETLPDMWKLVADVKAGQTTYSVEDVNSLAGFQYYYQVLAYQSAGNPTFKSRVTGATVAGGVPAYTGGYGDPSTFYLPPQGATPFSPVQVASVAANAFQKKVMIVPNPYIKNDPARGITGYTYEATIKVRLLNLPSKCIIRFFTIAGDLAAEFTHNSATVGEETFLQLNRTVTNQLFFGTYFVTIESQDPASMGQIQRTYFVVIR
ncbi:MAG: fibronectin type III domain-containing protein [Candidatus Latescibacteria bacterium]|nr:fibronectin type III domain-containing protein [Candidatus Latescibacterota bacterium]